MVNTCSKAIRFPPPALDVARTWCTGRRIPPSDTDTRWPLDFKARSAVFLNASTVFIKPWTFSSALFARAASVSAFLFKSLAVANASLTRSVCTESCDLSPVLSRMAISRSASILAWLACSSATSACSRLFSHSTSLADTLGPILGFLRAVGVAEQLKGSGQPIEPHSIGSEPEGSRVVAFSCSWCHPFSCVLGQVPDNCGQCKPPCPPE